MFHLLFDALEFNMSLYSQGSKAFLKAAWMCVSQKYKMQEHIDEFFEQTWEQTNHVLKFLIFCDSSKMNSLIDECLCYQSAAIDFYKMLSAPRKFVEFWALVT